MATTLVPDGFHIIRLEHLHVPIQVTRPNIQNTDSVHIDADLMIVDHVHTGTDLIITDRVHTGIGLMIHDHVLQMSIL
jgi:hypothetical protein